MLNTGSALPLQFFCTAVSCVYVASRFGDPELLLVDQSFLIREGLHLVLKRLSDCEG